MQTITTKFEESRARLVQQGSLFVQQTSTAATTFVEKTKKAGEKFVADTKKASDQLTASATSAGKAFTTGLSAEASMWLSTLETSAKLPALPRDLDATSVPSPRVIEKDLLVRVEKLIDLLAHRVHDRVLFLDTLTGPQLPATTAPKSAKASNGAAAKASVEPKASSSVTGAPISGYDELSAKDIVAKLERLSDEKTAAVIAYETANKKRATILRAAEQRLAEA